jgi:predicted acetyltransferase
VTDPELVNPVAVEEARPWLTTLVATMLGTPYDDDFAHRLERWERSWLPERTWGARADGRWVATLATVPRRLTVPGGLIGDGNEHVTADLDVDALTGVTVAATHRRQGLLTRMITQSLGAAKERGDALSMLIAAEYPIYGRFGYAPAASGASYVYHPKRPRAALPAPPPGSVRATDAAELRDIAPSVFARARRLRPGQPDREHPWWDRFLGADGYHPLGPRPNWVLHEGPDGPDGVLGWHVERDFDLMGNLARIVVDQFAAATERAYRELWGYLGGIDAVGEIFLDDRPVDEPIRWALPDARALAYDHVFDFLWLRLLDVPAALAARTYAVPVSLVLDVLDDEAGGYARGRYRLEVDESGRATCATTRDAADLRVGQRALAAGYLGGSRLRNRTFAGDVEELTAGALDRADVAFSTPFAPWCQTGF